MSDLHIALVLVGALVIGGVYAYNLWQERKLRTRLEQAFGSAHGDALLDPSQTPATARIEPRLAESQEVSSQQGVIHAPTPGQPQSIAASAEGADPFLEFVMSVELRKPASADALQALRTQLAVFGKPARLLVWDEAQQHWFTVDHGNAIPGSRVQAALLLANRSGAVRAPQLNGFADAVTAWARQLGGESGAYDVAAGIKAAQALDALASELDVAIGLNIIALPGNTFNGEHIAKAAFDARLTLERNGIFYFRDESGSTLFTMESHESEGIPSLDLASVQTSGLTLLLDLPHVIDAEAALEVMAAAGTQIAEALGGLLVDDNRVPLQAPGLARIKAQLHGLHEAMAGHGIPAGGARALRLFA